MAYATRWSATCGGNGRCGSSRVLVCNSVAQSIIESVRGMHPEFVFVYSHPRHKTQNYRPIETMNNTAWQSWRERCGLHGFRVHDLRHTVGMRLREAGRSRVDARRHPVAQPCGDDGALLGRAGCGDSRGAEEDHRREAREQRVARLNHPRSESPH